MSGSKTLLFVCVAFTLGIAIESFVSIPQVFLWVFLFILVCLIVTFAIIKNKPGIILGFCLLALLLGVERMQMAKHNVALDPLNQLVGTGKVTLLGVVVDQPDIRNTQQKLKVDIAGSLVLVSTTKFPEYSYLDKIKLTGKFEAPPVFDDFNYQNYLLKDGIYTVASYPKIEIISGEHDYTIFSFLYEKILISKNKLRQSIENNFSLSQALILDGIVLGDNKNMTDNLKQQLNITGLRHVTAISGSNIVVLSAVLLSFIMLLGCSRRQAFYISITFIWFYITLTGLSASGIRAGIMGSILMVAWHLGRQNTSQRTIVFACAVMLMQNPFLLAYDVGFQLSFLASAGIIYLKPSLDILINMVLKKKLKDLIDIISATLSAQIFTIPIMVYNFGTVSLVSLITNILVSPVIPWILTLGFIFSIVAIFSNTLALIFLIPAWGLTGYLLKVMEIFSKPWAMMSFNKTSWLWLLLMYILIIWMTFILRRKFIKSYVY